MTPETNTDLAIIAGTGQLPQEIICACPQALFVRFSTDVVLPSGPHFTARFEKLGALFAHLQAHDITKVVFAGALARPKPDPAQFDQATRDIWPGLMRAMAAGDDGLLREIIAMFQARGISTIGAHQAVPGLLATPEMTCGGALSPQDAADIGRGFDILASLSAHDVAQAIVVEGGQVLGIETLQGTDAMLDFVAQTKAHLRRGRGFFIKTAKQGQDLRVDMPVVGPDTVLAVARAGLAGLAMQAGQGMILNQEQVFELLAAHGLRLWVQA